MRGRLLPLVEGPPGRSQQGERISARRGPGRPTSPSIASWAVRAAIRRASACGEPRRATTASSVSSPGRVAAASISAMPMGEQVGLAPQFASARPPVGQLVGCGPPRPERRARTRSVSMPAKRSSAPRCSAGRVSRTWSDWPWTATSRSASSPSTPTGVAAPPTYARERPAELTVRRSTSPVPSSRSPPAATTRWTAGEDGGSSSRPSTLSLVRARTDPGGIGPSAEQQQQAGDHHRLARARLAGDHGEPRAEGQHGLVDDPEPADVQLLEHGQPILSTPLESVPGEASRRLRTGSWNLLTSRSAKFQRVGADDAYRGGAAAHLDPSTGRAPRSSGARRSSAPPHGPG